MFSDAYTLNLVRDDYIQVDFLDPLSERDYAFHVFMTFFRRNNRKRRLTIIGGGKPPVIDGVICPWQDWCGYLIALGFLDNAKAVCSILNELDAPDMDDYLENQLFKAKILKPDPRQPKNNKKMTKERRKHLENLEIMRRLNNMVENKEEMEDDRENN